MVASDGDMRVYVTDSLRQLIALDVVAAGSVASALDVAARCTPRVLVVAHAERRCCVTFPRCRRCCCRTIFPHLKRRTAPAGTTACAPWGISGPAARRRRVLVTHRGRRHPAAGARTSPVIWAWNVSHVARGYHPRCLCRYRQRDCGAEATRLIGGVVRNRHKMASRTAGAPNGVRQESGYAANPSVTMESAECLFNKSVK